MGLYIWAPTWMEDGRLVQVTEVEVEIPQAYYFVRRIQDRDDLKLQQLYIWLKGLFTARESKHVEMMAQA